MWDRREGLGWASWMWVLCEHTGYLLESKQWCYKIKCHLFWKVAAIMSGMWSPEVGEGQKEGRITPHIPDTLASAELGLQQIAWVKLQMLYCGLNFPSMGVFLGWDNWLKSPLYVLLHELLDTPLYSHLPVKTKQNNVRNCILGSGVLVPASFI